VQDGYLCTTCTTSLAADLGEIPGLLADLEITRTRQDTIGDTGTGRRTRAVLLPWKEHASEAYWILATTTLCWVREVHDKIGADPSDPVTDDPPHWPGWLVRHMPALRVLPSVGQVADEIGVAVDLARRAIDQPPVRIYLGPCEAAITPAAPDGPTACPTDLYGLTHAEEVTCPACGAAHVLARRREWLLGRARDRLAPIPTLSLALSTWLERTVTPSQLRGYVHRGRLLVHGRDRRGQDLYRVGDAADVVVDVWRAQQRHVTG
jgi:hypothetical protein